MRPGKIDLVDQTYLSMDKRIDAGSVAHENLAKEWKAQKDETSTYFGLSFGGLIAAFCSYTCTATSILLEKFSGFYLDQFLLLIIEEHPQKVFLLPRNEISKFLPGYPVLVHNTMVMLKDTFHVFDHIWMIIGYDSKLSKRGRPKEQMKIEDLFMADEKKRVRVRQISKKSHKN